MAQGLKGVQLPHAGRPDISHGKYVPPCHLPIQLFVPKPSDMMPERDSSSIDGYTSNVLSKDEKAMIFTIQKLHSSGIYVLSVRPLLFKLRERVSNMIVEVIEEPVFYDGSQIDPLWAYKRYGVLGDSIIVFRGGMDIAEARMKDSEDVRGKTAITGDDVLHFIIERFDSPGNMFTSYLMQRLFVISAQAVLNMYGIETARSGDDLYVAEEKLTVSIATASITSEKIHLGMNVTTSGTPKNVAITSLTSFGIEPDESLSIGRDVAELFSREILDILKDVVKTRGS